MGFCRQESWSGLLCPPPWALLRIDSLDLLAVQGTLKSLLPHHSSKAYPGALPQRRVVWLWFGALPRAVGLGRAQPHTASDLASITSHIHSWVLFLLWLHPFILSGVISPLISMQCYQRSILNPLMQSYLGAEGHKRLEQQGTCVLVGPGLIHHGC